VTAGEFDPRMPVGAEKTASGYEVAWKATGFDQYTVRNTDSTGHFRSEPVVVVSGRNPALGWFWA